MSISPSGTSTSAKASIRAWSRLARKAPREWMPTRASPSAPPFFSRISCATRTSVRCTSSRSRIEFSLTGPKLVFGRSGVSPPCPFLASLDPVKGTDGTSVPAASDDSCEKTARGTAFLYEGRLAVERRRAGPNGLRLGPARVVPLAELGRAPLRIRNRDRVEVTRDNRALEDLARLALDRRREVA